MIGNRYGRWVVVGKSSKPYYYKCLCDCGDRKEVSKYSLIKGKSVSCGCFQKEQSHKANTRNLVGEKYEKLTVIGETEDRRNTDIIWKCKCDCGNTTFIPSGDWGKINSCGCIRSLGEYKIQNLLEENGISFKKEYSFTDLKYKNPLRFDFAILREDGSLNHLVEYDGIQHFKPTSFCSGKDPNEMFLDVKKRDCMKNEYCLENNIQLIRIKYNEKINLEKILGGKKYV